MFSKITFKTKYRRTRPLQQHKSISARTIKEVIAEDTKALFFGLVLSAARVEEGKAWVDGVAGVVCYGRVVRVVSMRVGRLEMWGPIILEDVLVIFTSSFLCKVK